MNEVRMTVIRRKDTGAFLTGGRFEKKWAVEFYHARLYSSMAAKKVLEHYKEASTIKVEAVASEMKLGEVKEL